MTVSATRLVRGQPLSPPQSTNGECAPESHQDPCPIIPPYYSPGNTFDAAGLHGNRMGGDGAYEGPTPPQSMSYDSSSSSSQYAPTGDYAQPVPLQHPVNTPPPTLDEGLMISNTSDPTSLRWRSPSVQRSARAKTKGPRDSRARRRHMAKERPDLPGPLSELTKHMTHIPVKDMGAWVHRPIETRRQEVTKKNGKVARPMNSFMLYRSAYAERTKQWISQNNHQEVSAAAGISWKMEPPEIREKYEMLANIEKKNHIKAHPGYRFSPSKDKKKRPASSDGRRNPGQAQNTPESSPDLGHHIRDLSYSEIEGGWESRGSTPFSFIDQGYLGSSWQTSNPGRSVPGLMPSPEPTPYIQQTTIHQNLMGAHVEDVRFERVDLQDMQYTSSTALAGLPGAAHHDLLQPQSSAPGRTDSQLDPQLLSFQSDAGSTSGGNQVYGSSHYPVWQETSATNSYLPVATSLPPSTMSYPVESTYTTGMQTLVDSRDAWDASQETSLEASVGEFDHWLNHQASGY
ncbi:hypothetical protein BDV59DRAFT_111996 [Aspergillus ambiguus]|uniref:uncharacterized protein n=1 Tax=Aspergillus ambiguus TaxID=176160 RepID=UPI003CCCDD2F